MRDDWLYDALREVVTRGADYGRSPADGRRVQVEFVSANPTGPLTLGHARNAVIGDALARLLAFTGWTVEREYYFNDAGGQMDRFGASVEASYLRAAGRDAEVPEDGYHGAYIGELAADILATEGAGLADLPPDERFVRLREEGARRVLEWIRASLERFGVHFDVFFSEELLGERGEIETAVERLRERGHAYEAEGAVWFRATAFGDDKDRVVIRSDGTHTYFGADIAYIVDKYGRGFDRLIYVLGADHHGTVARLKGAAEALGFDQERMEIVIYQWVSFLRGGEPVAMSKRAGTFIGLDELIDEVGVDAARFTLLTHSNDSTMSFDLEVVQRQSMDNPVYYVQYAHARLASILAKAPARRGRAEAGRGDGPLAAHARGRARPPAHDRGAPTTDRPGRGAACAAPTLVRGAGACGPRAPVLHGVPGRLRRRPPHTVEAVAGRRREAGDRDPARPDGRLGARGDGAHRWLRRSGPTRRSRPASPGPRTPPSAPPGSRSPA